MFEEKVLTSTLLRRFRFSYDLGKRGPRKAIPELVLKPNSQGARVKVDTNLLREGLSINFGLGGWENREMARLTIQTGRVRELFTPEVGVICGKSQTV